MTIFIVLLGKVNPNNTVKLTNRANMAVAEFEYMITPGHTPGGLCILYSGDHTYLFSGDVVFREGIGRTDFPSSSPQDMESSLRRLSQVKFDYLLPGHDY